MMELLIINLFRTISHLIALILFTFFSSKKRNLFIVRLSLVFIVYYIFSIILNKLYLYCFGNHNINVILAATNLFFIPAIVFLYNIDVGQATFKLMAANTAIIFANICYVLIFTYFLPEYFISSFSFVNELLSFICTTIIVFICYIFIARKWNSTDSFIILNPIISLVIYGAIIYINNLLHYYAYKLMLLSYDPYFLLNSSYCLLTIILVYSIYHIQHQAMELQVIEQILYDKEKHYQDTTANIETINAMCHDFKYLISAIKNKSYIEQDDYIDDLQNSIQIYEKNIKTGNDILDSILTEKALKYKNQAQLTYIADGKCTNFIKPIDLYILIGNAIDNAIEAVERLENNDKRTISLTITNNAGICHFQIINYFNGKLNFIDGLPQTTKALKPQHGYGLKSIKKLTNKYNGSIVVSTKDDLFILDICIPIPS